MSNWPFSVLGIEADADPREIKRAYARMLKAVHPEDDPDGFQALRQAYEAAASGHWSGYAEPGEAGDEASTLEAETSAVVEAAEPDRRDVRTLVPQSASIEDELAELKTELYLLIAADKATPEDRLAAAQAVLLSPALDNVSTLTQTEAWFGGLIAEYPGPADVLVEPVVARFGWSRHEREWSMPWYVAAVLQRRDALLFLGRLRDPKGPYAKGVRLLQAPPRNGLSTFLGARKVTPVLQLLSSTPGLMSEFDYDVVQQWHERIEKMPFKTPSSKGSAWRLFFLVVWVAVILFRCVLPDGPVRQAADDPMFAASPKATVAQCRDQARAALLQPAADMICVDAEVRGGSRLSVLGDRALIRLRDGRAKEAYELWSTVLKTSPNDARALYGRGLASLLLNQTAAGHEDIGRALALNSSVSRPFIELGFTHAADIWPAKTASESAILRDLVAQPHVSPNWLEKPDRRTLEDQYPVLAARDERAARVVLDCAFDTDGRPAECMVVSESLQDYGFADAALALSGKYRADPAAAPKGARVRLPFLFKMES